MVKPESEQRTQPQFQFPLERHGLPPAIEYLSPHDQVGFAYLRKQLEQSIDIQMKVLKQLGAEVACFATSNGDPQNLVLVIFPLDNYKNGLPTPGLITSRKSTYGLHLRLNGRRARVELVGISPSDLHDRRTTIGGQPLHRFNSPGIWRVMKTIMADIERLPPKVNS